MAFAIDRLVLTPRDINPARSPLAGLIEGGTVIRAACNPALARLDNGNLLMMVRVGEALRRPVEEGMLAVPRWQDGGYALDRWPVAMADTGDPRHVIVGAGTPPIAVPTSLSWLLPVELAADGLSIVALHYDRAIAPAGSWAAYGLEDPRIVRIDGRWLMTVCCLSPERIATALYTSDDGLAWRFDDLVMDHHNRDMILFDGLIDGRYWAQTRPLGELYLAYPPGSEWRGGPSINLATSPDARHWKPVLAPGIRPHAATTSTARVGGGAPPVRFAEGWLSLWHGAAPGGAVGSYKTYWSLLDADDPSIVRRTSHPPLLSPDARLTAEIAPRAGARDVVYTTGLVLAETHAVVASGEADLACRITHIPLAAFEGGDPQ